MMDGSNFFQKIGYAGVLFLLLAAAIGLASPTEQSVSAMKALQVEETHTPTPTPLTATPTPTLTPTPATGLSLISWSGGCTTGPYITCSASMTSTHTDPYRWDFDITFHYNDNRSKFGSKFTFQIRFATGVFYTDVPIYWNMYPIENEVMPSRSINVLYAGASALASMDYPSGVWTIPAQPIPYDKFDIIFSRTTTAPEILVRTDKWHLTVSTYPNIGTPTPTPTAAATATITLTPSNTPTPMTYAPVAGTPQSNGSGTCWYSGSSWNSYTVYFDILLDGPYAVPPEWVVSIHNAKDTWNDVVRSQFQFVRQIGNDNTVRYEEPINKTAIAVAAPFLSSGFMTK